MSFIDSYSRSARTHTIGDDREGVEKLRLFCSNKHVHKTCPSLLLRSDGKKASDVFCFAQRIEKIALYFPHQIDVTERLSQTVGNMDKCLLK